jgi:hypothetical protein
MLGSFALGQQALGAYVEGGRPGADTTPPTTPGGVGGYDAAWRSHWQDAWRRGLRRAQLRALIHESEDYKRARRKLAMLHEHLMMAEQYKDARKIRIIREKIEAVEHEIEMMERLD